jgi:hypothetical protein
MCHILLYVLCLQQQIKGMPILTESYPVGRDKTGERAFQANLTSWKVSQSLLWEHEDLTPNPVWDGGEG